MYIAKIFSDATNSPKWPESETSCDCKHGIWSDRVKTERRVTNKKTVVVPRKKVPQTVEILLNPEFHLIIVNGWDKAQSKLIKLILNLDLIPGKINIYLRAVAALNSIINSSKESLRYLKILAKPMPFEELFTTNSEIKIPKLANLTFLYLIDATRSKGVHYVRWDRPIFEFENGKCSQLMFPKLSTLIIFVKQYIVDGNRLNGFFPYNTYEVGKDKYIFESVRRMEIINSIAMWPSISEAEALCKLFPNIQSLRIRCDSVKELDSSLWALCPLAESITIYGITNPYNVTPFRNVNAVDSFFTGIPIGTCSQLLELKNLSEIENGNGNGKREKCMQIMDIEVKRTMPSICDMHNLKSVKVLFGTFSGPFFSRISYIFAFNKMPKLILEIPSRLIPSTYSAVLKEN